MKSGEKRTSTMSFAGYLWVFVVACLCFGAFMVSVNYFVDRYYVFHPQDGEFYEFLEPNTRYLKASFLERRCTDFNAIVMGSSRDVGYSTDVVNRAFEVTSYNYGVAAGNLRGVFARLQWLASIDCLPREIILPLSIDKLRLPQRPDDLLRKEHPAIVATSSYRREFSLSYLGTDAFISNARKLLRVLRGKRDPKFRYNMATGDVWYLWDRTFAIEKCGKLPSPVERPVIEEYVELLFAIDSLARDNDSAITLIWNPQPLGSQLAHLQDTSWLFALISERFDTIYRLPLDDSRLSDSDFYHDEGHFTHELGASVLSSPENRVSMSYLLSELHDASQVCGYSFTGSVQ